MTGGERSQERALSVSTNALKAILALLLAVFLTFVVLGFANYGSRDDKPPLKEYGQVACTMEAKICPDGTAVGRTGPNCEFTACPAATTTPLGATGVLRGTVTLSPICPVERMPPDPNCAPRGYEGRIEVLRTGAVFASAQSNAQGQFMFTLPPGAYEVRAVGKNPFPSCMEKQPFSVISGNTVSVELSCDTGIR